MTNVELHTSKLISSAGGSDEPGKVCVNANTKIKMATGIIVCVNKDLNLKKLNKIHIPKFKLLYEVPIYHHPIMRTWKASNNRFRIEYKNFLTNIAFNC